MSNEKNIRIVRGSSRFVGEQDKDEGLQPLLTADQRQLIQGERNLVLNLRDQFGLEREYSYRYRLSGKIDILYENIISGQTNDNAFLRNMYFLPDYLGCPDSSIYPMLPNNGPPCEGLPPSMTFNMIPPDRYGGVGTTAYNILNAYQDNWLLYLSYVYSATCQQTMNYVVDPPTNSIMTFTACDGIPFEVEIITINGKEIARFTTPVPHGLNIGEFIGLQPAPLGTGPNQNIVTQLITAAPNTIPAATLPTNAYSIMPVDSLGNEFEGSEEYIINVDLRGVQPLPSYSVGTLKRIINLDNILESESQYYVHQHKLTTHANDYTLDRTGFEEGIYNKKGRVFTARKTHNNTLKTTIYEEYYSYLWCATRDMNLENYQDNLGRPITDMYLTVLPTNKNLLWNYQAMQSPAGYGWSWNFRPNGFPEAYVDNDINPINLTQVNNAGAVYPISGHTFRGAFVEYNELELKERIISEIGHSLKFNRPVLHEVGNPAAFVKSIYKYQPHHRIALRKFSTTITTNDALFTSPQYARYSTVSELFRWRPILPIEFYEDNYNGVSYPYLNDAHYPSKNIEFKIKPILFNYSSTSLTVLSQMTDDC